MTKKEDELDTAFTQTPDDGLRKVLDRHGHGFQYATLKRCLEVGDADHRWKFWVSEFPVTLNGASMHVDFVLGFESHVLVAECKRVQGFRWGFARGLWTVLDRTSTRPRADFLYWLDGPRRLARRTCSFGNPSPPYEVAVELKNYEKSQDEENKTPKNFEQAVGQVLRARGGLMETLETQFGHRYAGGAIIPVIFTTAPLLTTETELAVADIKTGHLPKELKATDVDWLWFDQNLTSALRPNTKRVEPSESQTKTEALRNVLARDMTRSIGIVNTAGINSFLGHLAMSLTAPNDPL